MLHSKSDKWKKVYTLNNYTALDDIKKEIESLIENKIRLRANRGRNRIVEKEGILESIYPNLFVVKLNDKKRENLIDRRVSYTYSDMLTETVELFVYDKHNEQVKVSAN